MATSAASAGYAAARKSSRQKRKRPGKIPASVLARNDFCGVCGSIKQSGAMGLANRHHVHRRVGETIKIQKIVDFAIEESTDVQRPESEGIRDKVQILRHMARFQQDKAISAITVLEDG